MKDLDEKREQHSSAVAECELSIKQAIALGRGDELEEADVDAILEFRFGKLREVGLTLARYEARLEKEVLRRAEIEEIKLDAIRRFVVWFYDRGDWAFGDESEGATEEELLKQWVSRRTRS